MIAGDMPKELASLLKRLNGEYAQSPPPSAAPAIDPGEPLLGLMLRSFLVWECTTSKATLALKRVEQGVVDFNELRICTPDEVVRMRGERYPRSEDRAVRLRCALNDVYRREHRVSLEHLHLRPKREAREYFDSLEGLPSFVAARVELLGLGAHAAPVDSRIARRLAEADAIEPGTGPEDAAKFLERKVRAGDMPQVYALLQAWADDGTFPSGETWTEGERMSLRSAWSRTPPLSPTSPAGRSAASSQEAALPKSHAESTPKHSASGSRPRKKSS